MKWVLAQDATELERGAFKDFESTLELEGEILDESTSNWLKKVKVGEKHYYLKKYHRPGKYLRRYLGFSQVSREWRNAQRFLHWHVPTARPVVFGEGDKWGGEYWGIYASEECVGALSLEQACLEDSPLFASKALRRQMLRALGKTVAKLHSYAFFHNDLHWRNILVGPDADRVCIIDCPAGRPVYLPGNPRGLIKDLALLDKMARTHLTRADRLRFYVAYKGLEDKSDLKYKKRLKNKQKREIKKILAFLDARISS